MKNKYHTFIIKIKFFAKKLNKKSKSNKNDHKLKNLLKI